MTYEEASKALRTGIMAALEVQTQAYHYSDEESKKMYRTLDALSKMADQGMEAIEMSEA